MEARIVPLYSFPTLFSPPVCADYRAGPFLRLPQAELGLGKHWVYFSESLGVFFTLCQDSDAGEYLPIPLCGFSGCKSHKEDHYSPLDSHSMSSPRFICLLLRDLIIPFRHSSCPGPEMAPGEHSFFQGQQLVYGRYSYIL